MHMYMYICICVCVYIYIYIYISRVEGLGSAASARLRLPPELVLKAWTIALIHNYIFVCFLFLLLSYVVSTIKQLNLMLFVFFTYITL